MRSIADTFCKSKPHESGQVSVSGRLDMSRAVATAKGRDCSAYGEDSITGFGQVNVVNALRSGDRSKASCLLSRLACENNYLGGDGFLYILEYCVKAPDPLFVMETWRKMEENGVYVSERCYILIIRAFCEGGYLDEAFNFLKNIGEHHCIHAILPLYNTFLGSCVQMRSLIHVNLCLDLMDHRLVGKNEVTYWELLKLAVWQQNISAVHEIRKEYVKYYSPSIFSLRQFIWSFTRLRDLQAAYEALQHMVALAFKDNEFFYRTGKGKLSSSRLDIPVPTSGTLSLEISGDRKIENSVSLLCEDFKATDTRLADLGNSDMIGMTSREVVGVKMRSLKSHDNKLLLKVLRWSFSDVIHACAQNHNCIMAKQLMLQMQHLGLEPSSHTYDGFIRVIVSERGSRDGIELLKIMERQNLKPYDSTLATLATGCSKDLELDLAEALLERISEAPCAHSYNAYLLACGILDKPERALRILAKMKKIDVLPDIRTYELLFSLFGNVNAPYERGNFPSQVDVAKRILAIEMNMVQNGVRHSHLSMKNLLKALGAEGMIRDMMHYLNTSSNHLCLVNNDLGTAMYNIVLHSLVEAKKGRIATEVFKSMKSCGILSDAATYNILIDCCRILECYKSACAVVSMMIRDGFSPQAETYIALIKILLEGEDFDEALNLFYKASSEGIKPNILLFNTILRGAFFQDRIDVVELIMEQMQQDKIQPDPSTCSYVFSAYASSGFHNTAMEALQVLSMRMISNEESILEEKRSEYEDLILAEDLEAESRIIQLFTDYKENLAVALLNLRWTAMVGFPISWSLNKNPWAKRFE